jgi:hypothetical protein
MMLFQTYISLNRSNNPLSDEEFDDAMAQAAAFWDHYDLRHIVDKDDFVKGALVFNDLEGAREFEHNSPQHTEEQLLSYSERDKRFAQLSARQRASIKWFTRRTDYLVEERAGNVVQSGTVVKRLIFAVVDAVVNVLLGISEPAEKKSLWDHMKTCSTAQWQIFCTCCLAAMTQFVQTSYIPIKQR